MAGTAGLVQIVGVCRVRHIFQMGTFLILCRTLPLVASGAWLEMISIHLHGMATIALQNCFPLTVFCRAGEKKKKEQGKAKSEVHNPMNGVLR